MEEYLIDLNATKAAERAGFSPKTARSQGQRLLTNVDIATSIKEAIDARSRRTQLSQDWVIEQLMENHARAMTAEPVRDKWGNPTGIFTYEGAVANKSLELLGKHLKMFTERLEHSVPEGGGVLAVPVPVTSEQWAEMASRQQSETSKG